MISIMSSGLASLSSGMTRATVLISSCLEGLRPGQRLLLSPQRHLPEALHGSLQEGRHGSLLQEGRHGSLQEGLRRGPPSRLVVADGPDSSIEGVAQLPSHVVVGGGPLRRRSKLLRTTRSLKRTTSGRKTNPVRNWPKDLVVIAIKLAVVGWTHMPRTRLGITSRNVPDEGLVPGGEDGGGFRNRASSLRPNHPTICTL